MTEINGIPEVEEAPVDDDDRPTTMTPEEVEEAREQEDAAEAQAEEDAQAEYDDEDDTATEAEAQADDGGDDRHPQSEAPAAVEPEPEPYTGSNEDLIATAVEISFADFSRRHTMTAKHLKVRIGDPVAVIVQSLMRDEAYRSLVSRTAEASDVADIVKVISGIALKVAERIIAGL